MNWFCAISNKNEFILWEYTFIKNMKPINRIIDPIWNNKK